MTDNMTENTNLIAGATGDWEIVIGLEVHAQVSSDAKLFSGAATTFGASRTRKSRWSMRRCRACCRLSIGMREQAVRTGLGLKSEINRYSVFDRKNYFYPDLPQGYQISQYLQPIVGEGEIEIDLEGGAVKKSALSAFILSRMRASRCTTSTLI